MTLKSTILLLSCLAFACKQKATTDTDPEIRTETVDSLDSGSYRIVSSQYDTVTQQLIMDVEVTKQEDSTGLRYLAVMIQRLKSDSLSAINFFLPGSTHEHPYATAQFNPQLVVTIKSE